MLTGSGRGVRSQSVRLVGVDVSPASPFVSTGGAFSLRAVASSVAISWILVSLAVGEGWELGKKILSQQEVFQICFILPVQFLIPLSPKICCSFNNLSAR